MNNTPATIFGGLIVLAGIAFALTSKGGNTFSDAPKAPTSKAAFSERLFLTHQAALDACQVKGTAPVTVIPETILSKDDKAVVSFRVASCLTGAKPSVTPPTNKNYCPTNVTLLAEQQLVPDFGFLIYTGDNSRPFQQECYEPNGKYWGTVDVPVTK